MQNAKERFLRYVCVDTQSEEGVERFPSTEKQFDLARMLEKELIEMGADDVRLDRNCYVTATIPSSPGVDAPVMGLICHMDTSDAVSGKDVRPVLTKNYGGGAIDMGNGYTLSPEAYPALLEEIGHEIISTDGTTLLGADDKAGIAEVMAASARWLSNDAPRHGTIRICFTPDEEVGRGVDFFDVESFHADFAYTVDGGALGEINFENFNAANVRVSFTGTSIHPGDAKGKMVNAALIAVELTGMLPALETPAATEGYEGYFHLERLTAGVDSASALFLIRDHDREKFERRKALFADACAYLNGKYGAGSVSADIRDAYYNMKEKIDPALITAAEEAMKKVGVTPRFSPIRGGTDGARLSYMGLPCPNLCTGGHNFHGRYEFISAESLEKMTELLIALAERFIR